MKVVIKNSDVKYGGKLYSEGSEPDLNADELKGLEGFYEPLEEKKKAKGSDETGSKKGGSKKGDAKKSSEPEKTDPEGGTGEGSGEGQDSKENEGGKE